ncbi:MAG: Metallopeptidase [Candidatus Beckwithbacteria bacterium GW2011_GWB1_47_15]|uniref:Metallopeptidase n=1 Tax=Candidatus Beckwithbacteria bacterium GW2011_GWB1_47_15 TaxID=1618371 RepID=A0A0G1U358_9BACT|nr:MAG: hypothetical protein UY43_C0001G0526 [Candidatus Beckwithbacteria bacterium GW2011_GWC1_49_16]KKU35124.1 MAG: Metallopeptidase [Candidatus Beckwithbacteria bacterium GW2011_GWA1_46_30]KKU60768.1 MAG: Metallopeptidase [Candidatus Beckwithbacteria bacterium GW2011_GWB1_47_15]KKU71573.1 MAG: Metallopeptidase [Candidatus Beckwithbacteria bacterium GW2011_GWA2_47_25]KKW03474.1 MAG: Metallopeptidase [Candidatus Beckwithbacteria bacterium GW2011_GWC2_49_11]OGD49152.1 MAG: hypothetical protein
MDLQLAPDIKKRLKKIHHKLDLPHVNPDRIVCFRSFHSRSRARARIWGFPKIWQLALGKPPHYVIEVLAEKFDHLSADDQTRVLIHELLHIPKNFSGALLPHRRRGFSLDHRSVENLFKLFKS